GNGTEFRIISPHCQDYVDIKNDKGEVEHWQGELTAPNKLARAAWTKHSLNPGDQITVTGLVGKYGGHSIWIPKLVGPDREELQLSEDESILPNYTDTGGQTRSKRCSGLGDGQS